ncbi:uncharacterized protein LOC110985908 isoform X2 [Acanthaster planci]|nr:uncharacterized protein LOC110985908 isoform X2 [Acanthaster planci]XP_022103053.1 uncharacterized protein LOC110985908 isoform X2 [Acanthaster planci]
MDPFKSQSDRNFTSLVSEIMIKNETLLSAHHAERSDSGLYKAQFLKWWEERGRDEKLKEEDAIETIKRRLEEIGGMMTSRRPRVVENSMDRMATPLREHVKRLSAITPKTYRRLRLKDKGSLKVNAVYKFRYASTMVRIISRRCRAGKKYLPLESSSDNPESNPEVNAALKTSKEAELKKLNSVATMKTSIGWDLQMNLTTQPQYRTAEQLKHILYMIHAHKAFTIFSSDCETELARCLSYERYDDGRIIACQGRPPDRFYYVVSGKVNLVREYELQTGTMTKSLGFLKKGSFSDREELEKQWNRQSSLICQGPVEVLLLNKEDFFNLQNTHAGPPIEFLRSQYLFSEFPCHLFSQHHEAIECKFYSPERLVARDSNSTRWIFVIKSGTCKCIRRQFVADVKSDKKFSKKKGLDKLGCVKQPSHADAMIGAGLKKLVEEGQHNFDHDLEMSKIQLVEEANMVGSPYVGTLGISTKDTPPTRGLRSRLTSHLRLRSSQATPPEIGASAADKFPRTPGDMGFNFQDSLLVKDYAARRRFQSPHRSIHSFHGSPALLPPLSSVMDPPIDNSSGCFLSPFDRPKRKFTHQPVAIHATTPSAQRRAYIQLDGLVSGDIFGLNDVAFTASSEPSGVSVVSEGAEIIKINKRFFRTHAGVVTLLKLDTLVREFMSEEDASENLERQETWLRYKSTLMERLAQHKYQTNTKWKRNLKPLSFSI